MHGRLLKSRPKTKDMHSERRNLRRACAPAALARRWRPINLDGTQRVIASHEDAYIFCTSYSETLGYWEDRWGQWLSAIKGSSLIWDQILIVDDGSPILPFWDGVEIEDPSSNDGGSAVKIHHFRDRRGRDVDGQPFPGWYPCSHTQSHMRSPPGLTALSTLSRMPIFSHRGPSNSSTPVTTDGLAFGAGPTNGQKRRPKSLTRTGSRPVLIFSVNRMPRI